MTDSVPADAKAEVAQAVRAALAEHGYARLTTAKIAAEYPKSEAGLYYHFDSKDEMIAAFLEYAAGELADELADIGTDDPETRLRAACEYLFLSPGEEGAGVHVAVMELLSHAPHNETLREPLLTLESATLETLTAIVRDGVEQGVFRSVDPEATAAFLLAAADGSTGFHTALEMDVGEAITTGWSGYVDCLLADA
ncbi:TetR/AcrR family transcriptional regulator [Halomicroarcula sp. GCM10025709]|uniref:TetR/AcrR family transcriptional regulator n=1 Tax=Haloarcula TaxID=2237 RepID=UPI0024C31310|nr:TetR/AcrR family transcriptional regulator [Halomicroarcula sp. YJ-61-S]